MEKVVVVLQKRVTDDAGADGWAARLRGPVMDALLDLNLPGLGLNVRDSDVRGSVMALRTLDPPAQGFVSMWTQQHYGDEMGKALEILAAEADESAAYLVTESAPLPPPSSQPGHRVPGLANVALLRRPTDLDEATWRTRWLCDHTPVAIATQATFGYVQNCVVRPITQHAPPLAAIVEELFPIGAVKSLHEFFGAADDSDLQNRMSRMVASVSSFGAHAEIDAVPTSRYVFRTPFQSA